MSRTIVDFHVLQTVPPSNLNRDDTGSPKTAVYGGVRRARVSSQAWKRATRDAFKGLLNTGDLGIRTKRVAELIGERILETESGVEESAAQEAAAAVLNKAGIKVAEPKNKKGQPAESGYLLFLSALQVDALARLAVRSIADGGEIDKKEALAVIKGKNSIDLALFGRMVADVSDLNVDASTQVAHAISTHGVETEYDYFTAVDDHKNADADEDAGAGMIGTVEFNSATLYRYATVDADRLLDNLGDVAAVERAVRAFGQAFVRSMPTGKQNTFANRTLPDAIVISVREDQPVSFVGAFEEPVRPGRDQGRVPLSAEKLVQHARDLEEAFGGHPVHTWVTGVGATGDIVAPLGERVSLDDAVAALSTAVSSRLSADAPS